MSPILPQMLLSVILQAWPLVLCLVFEAQCRFYTRKYRTHTLVQLHRQLDLTPLEQGCAGFHQGSGKGSAVSHPVPRLVRALLLKYLQNLSFRQTEEQIDLNLLARWFVGYSWLETPPDHTTLCRFELWVLRHQPRLFFDFVLDLVLSHCPEERQRLFITDTFGIYVRGARTWTIELLRDLARRLLADLQQVDSIVHRAILARVDQAALFGQPGDLITPALKPAGRAERLQSVANAALDLHDALLARLDQAPFFAPEAEAGLRLWLTAIAKVIDDETIVTLDPALPGHRLISERPHGKKGAYRHACANDLDATYRDHGKGQAELQHNAGLTAARLMASPTLIVRSSSAITAISSWLPSPTTRPTSSSWRSSSAPSSSVSFST